MRKRGFMLLAAVLFGLAWAAAPLESAETIALARVLYHSCGQQSEETMRLYGSALLNRVGKREFGDTLGQVLKGCASVPYYDERALAAAREIVRGETGYYTAPDEVVYAVRMDEDHSAYADNGFWRVSGDFAFYYRT